VTVAGGLWAAGRAPAWSAEVYSPAKEIGDTGWQYLQQSAKAPTHEEAVRLLQAAIENFQAALEIDHNYCPAHHGWAMTLLAASGRTSTREEFGRAIQAARERFAYAAGCPNVQAQVFDDWGSMLMTRVDMVAESGYARYSILSEAREALVKGLGRAGNDEERAKFEGLLGQCLVRLVLYSPNPEERKQLFAEANTRFESATQRGAVGKFAGLYATWGLALLKLGQSDNDPAALRLGIERMQEGLRKVANDKDPAALVLHYNLACTHAALGDQSNALLHLRTCFENDPAAGYVRTAWNDSDLAPLRTVPDFQTLVRTYMPRAAPTPQDTPEIRARHLYRDGNDLLNKVVAAEDNPARARLLEQAVEKYRAATEQDPDFVSAHLMWANALVQAEALATNQTDRLERIQQTRDRFAAAAHCSTADSKVYEAWGAYLSSRADTLGAHPADKIAVLDEAVEIYEKGLTHSKFSGETAQLQTQLGMCLISIGGHESNRHKKRERYEKAARLLSEAAKIEAYAKSPRVNGMWGVSLVKLGQLTRDTFKLREATQRLTIALEAEPDNPEFNYNMACAYALLRYPDDAMRHLRVCFDRDPLGVYYKSAEADPDFAPIRTSEVYKDVFRPRLPPDDLTQPRLLRQ